VSVRAARANFSRLLDAVEGGADVLVLDRGRPRARIAGLQAPRRALVVDRAWLGRMKVSGGGRAEDRVRADRDGRG